MGHEAACSPLPAFWPSIPKLGLKVWWRFSHLQLCFMIWTCDIDILFPFVITCFLPNISYSPNFLCPQTKLTRFAGAPLKHLCIPRQQPGQRKPHKDQTSYHQVGWDGINAWLLKPKLLECQPTSVQMQSLLLTSNYSVAVPNEIAV